LGFGVWGVGVEVKGFSAELGVEGLVKSLIVTGKALSTLTTIWCFVGGGVLGVVVVGRGSRGLRVKESGFGGCGLRLAGWGLVFEIWG
jgi:hypothetical protein